MSKFGHNFSNMYRYKWSFVSIQMLWPTLKMKFLTFVSIQTRVCIDTNIRILKLLTDMYQIMQAWFDTSSTLWILRVFTYVSIHASMIRCTGDSLPLRNHFCIDTDYACIDTKYPKPDRSNFRTFVSIHQCMYRYKIPKSQFFKVLENSSLLSSHL